MPIFKTTYNILKSPDTDELFDPNWMDSDKLILPPKEDWDYKREMTIEDVDIWEQIYFSSGGTGLYAAWSPYAEFYLIINNVYYNPSCPNSIETFYGKRAGERAYKRGIELGMHLSLNKKWVDSSEMWLYS